MHIEYSEEFKKRYRRLPTDIQERTKKQLRLLLKDPRHPSLNTNKLKSRGNLWQGRITKAYRFVFLIKGDTYYLVSLFHHK